MLRLELSGACSERVAGVALAGSNGSRVVLSG
jgi:hypothetical protein